MKGDRQRAATLLKIRAETRDATRFDQQSAVPTGWHESPIVTQGSQVGLLENVMRQLMARPTELERPDVTYSGGVPAWPICSSALPPLPRWKR